MRSLFDYLSALAGELFVGLSALVSTIVLGLPEITFVTSLVPQVLRFGAMVVVLAGALLTVGCSRQGTEPSKPAVIHWKGQDGGYEDTTTVPPAPNTGNQ
jgi:hypothetical protein